METLKTKQGFVMNRKLRARIVTAMAQGMAIGDVALLVGINRRTVQDYLTPEVREEIWAKRQAAVVYTLDDVDRAMLEQACTGNVAAARLVYMRMAQRGEVGPLPSLEEMEAELRKLRQLDEQRRGLNDGACVDGVAAVVTCEGGRAD